MKVASENFNYLFQSTQSNFQLIQIKFKQSNKWVIFERNHLKRIKRVSVEERRCKSCKVICKH
jgi:hypothetical protein